MTGIFDTNAKSYAKDPLIHINQFINVYIYIVAIITVYIYMVVTPHM